MDPASDSFGQLAANSNDFARRLLAIGENRLELLMVEVKEEQGHLLHAALLALGLAAFGLLAGITLTAAVAVLLWAYSPVGVLLSLTGIYVLAGVYVYRRLTEIVRDWKTLSATRGQLRKDPCLFGKDSRMDPPASRKQQLIAESELNRAHLAGDMAALTAGVRTLTDRAKSFGSVASSAAVLVAGLAAFQDGRIKNASQKGSLLQSILKGAGLISTLWLAFRSRAPNHENKPPRPHSESVQRDAGQSLGGTMMAETRRHCSKSEAAGRK